MKKKISKHSKSSKTWLKKHFNDSYVMRAKKEGWRSRASFKLLELNEKHNLFKKNTKVIDLGSAPGGWTQVATKQIGRNGLIIASDILPMEPIPGSIFIQGDFNDPSVFNQIISNTNSQKIDLVISDIAPNLSGNSCIDQSQAFRLNTIVLDLACNVLRKAGCMLIKVFQGYDFDQYLSEVRLLFKKVSIEKPKASAAKSKEVYLLAKKFKA